MDVDFSSPGCDETYSAWSWDGETCVLHDGVCECAGEDCDSVFDDEATCLVAYADCLFVEVCEETGGIWVGEGCDCGPGGGWTAEEGCFGLDEQQCEETGGTWNEADCGPYCGDCDCPVGLEWHEIGGCLRAEMPPECEPMDVQLEGEACFLHWGWAWDGLACVAFEGLCDCVGDDCEAFFETEEACNEAYMECLVVSGS